jgi:hypothetical protein
MSNIYHYVRPVDGFAFNKYELNDLFAIEVDITQTHIVKGTPMELRWRFFEHASKLEVNTRREEDTAARDLLRRALLAEYEDPEPKEEA